VLRYNAATATLLGATTVLVLDERKLLPPGVHDASLPEVEKLFGRFERSDRRTTLFRKLRDYLKKLNCAGCAGAVIIDGSYVMGCVDEPEDIDLVVVLNEDWDWDVELKPYQYNVVSKRRVKEQYGFDAFFVRPGSPQQTEWIAFFARVNVKWCTRFGWPDELAKGIVRVSL
jgi:hypothetical protein